MLKLMELSTASRFPTYTGGANLRFYYEGQIPQSLNDEEVSIKMYHNGVLLQDVTNYTKSPNGTISGFIVVNNATIHDDGIYEAELVWDYSNRCYHYQTQLLHLLYRNQYYYYYGGTYEELVVAKSHLKVSYVGKNYFFF